MKLAVARLRRGEVIAAAGAVLLLVSLFGLSWSGLSGPAAHSAQALGITTTLSGWQLLTTLRWLVLVTIVSALSLAYFQATCRAPALPSSLSAIVTVLGALTSVILIYRVLIDGPGPTALFGVRAGAYLGLVSAIALTAGAFMSLREEYRPDPQRNEAIEVVPIA